jgi:epoxyqueuosine reductase
LLRNAAIVLGNQRSAEALPTLIVGLNDAEPLVRGACAWALGQYSSAEAREALLRRRTMETDADVLVEIDSAIGGQA